MKKTILIVEDEKALAKALRVKLSKEGYAITVATNGKEALRVTADTTFDMILLDLIMPEMSGFEVLTKLRQRQYRAPVIIVSNLSQDHDIRKARELGVKDFIVKSDASLEEIAKKINAALQT